MGGWSFSISPNYVHSLVGYLRELINCTVHLFSIKTIGRDCGIVSVFPLLCTRFFRNRTENYSGSKASTSHHHPSSSLQCAMRVDNNKHLLVTLEQCFEPVTLDSSVDVVKFILL